MNKLDCKVLQPESQKNEVKEESFEFYLARQNIDRKGAVGGFASEPAFGLRAVGALANLDLFPPLHLATS